MARRKQLTAFFLLAVFLLLTASAYATHVRPKGATPKVDPLVIAYKDCTPSSSPPANANHTPSATQGQWPSCSPPTPLTPYTTVGSPDNNSLASDFVGTVRLDVGVGDVGVGARIDGIHCTASLKASSPAICSGAGSFPPYTGNLRVDLWLDITDHCNKTSSAAGPCPATPGLAATSWGFSVPIIANCTNVGNPGSRCNVTTTLNSLYPGFITAGYRTNIESRVLQVQDGGTDGDGMTPGNGILATEGIFVP
jgi:hypothetical protein